MKYNYLKDEKYNTIILTFEYNNDLYLLQVLDNYLYIDINNTQKKFILDEKGILFDYVYQIKKTKINIKNKDNFINHFITCFENDLAIECWCIDPVNHIYNSTKEA